MLIVLGLLEAIVALAGRRQGDGSTTHRGVHIVTGTGVVHAVVRPLSVADADEPGAWSL
jgi:hypothetical protein